MFTEIYQKSMQQQLDLIGANFNRLSHQLKRFSTVKKPEDFINLQKECFNENLTASIECIQSLYTLSMQNVEEFSKDCTNAQRESMSQSTHTKSNERNK